MNGRTLIAVLLLFSATAAMAESRLAWQLGYAWNMSLEGFTPAGEPSRPAGDPVNRHSLYLGLNGYENITSRLAIGLGMGWVLDRWPRSQTLAVWEMTTSLEYRMFRNIRLRGGFGVVKGYEAVPAYGRSFNVQILYPVTQRMAAGIGYIHGEINQEQGTANPGTDMEGGHVRVSTLFMEIAF